MITITDEATSALAQQFALGYGSTAVGCRRKNYLTAGAPNLTIAVTRTSA